MQSVECESPEILQRISVAQIVCDKAGSVVCVRAVICYKMHPTTAYFPLLATVKDVG